jgi:hypothetical protein
VVDLDKILTEHGGLEGLARKIGQGDPIAYRFEPAENDNQVPRIGLWRRLLRSLGLALH